MELELNVGVQYNTYALTGTWAVCRKYLNWLAEIS